MWGPGWKARINMRARHIENKARAQNKARVSISVISCVWLQLTLAAAAVERGPDPNEEGGAALAKAPSATWSYSEAVTLSPLQASLSWCLSMMINTNRSPSTGSAECMFCFSWSAELDIPMRLKTDLILSMSIVLNTLKDVNVAGSAQTYSLPECEPYSGCQPTKTK